MSVLYFSCLVVLAGLNFSIFGGCCCSKNKDRSSKLPSESKDKSTEDKSTDKKDVPSHVPDLHDTKDKHLPKKKQIPPKPVDYNDKKLWDIKVEGYRQVPSGCLNDMDLKVLAEVGVSEDNAASFLTLYKGIGNVEHIYIFFYNIFKNNDLNLPDHLYRLTDHIYYVHYKTDLNTRECTHYENEEVNPEMFF